MAISMRAMLHLEPGARLYYDCPFWPTDDAKISAFFKSHRGKMATFASYCEDFVGPLDHHGRLPGRYIRDSCIDVRFDGEEKLYKAMNIKHFIVLDTKHAKLVASDEGDRLGDLPHPIIYHPGDLVTCKDDVKKDQHEIGEVVLREDGTVVYEIRVGKRTREYKDEQISLVSRGNVWSLYHDPRWLLFESDEEENEFWAQDGVSRKLTDSIYPGISFAQAYALFKAGEADLIVVHDLEKQRMRYKRERGEDEGEPKVFAAHRLHDCFAEQRRRVRDLTWRLWSKRLKQVQ